MILGGDYIDAQDIVELITKQHNFRNNSINLIASENIMLPESEKYYGNEFMHRYAEGKPYKRYYNGTKYIDILEDETQNHFAKHFDVNYCDVRPTSGAIANLSVFSALAKNKKVITNSLPSGGHITHNKMGTIGKILNYDIKNFAKQDECPYKTDVDKSIRLIREFNPDFIVFGKSMFLFPEPIKEIKKEFPELIVVYDAAHVFGLIYQNEFQDPFAEGADILTASTHKTFPGPQGGIVLSKKIDTMDSYLFPAILSNHHLHRIPVLLMTAILLDSDKKYKSLAKRTIENAKYFAECLHNNGFNVACADYGFTETHQVVVDVSDIGNGSKVANILEQNNIIVNKNSLPHDTSVINPSGIRLGVQEMTLKGWDKTEFEELANTMKKILYSHVF